jgi:hypothetical protein
LRGLTHKTSIECPGTTTHQHECRCLALHSADATSALLWSASKGRRIKDTTQVRSQHDSSLLPSLLIHSHPDKATPKGFNACTAAQLELSSCAHRNVCQHACCLAPSPKDPAALPDSALNEATTSVSLAMSPARLLRPRNKGLKIVKVQERSYLAAQLSTSCSTQRCNTLISTKGHTKGIISTHSHLSVTRITPSRAPRSLSL